MDIRAPLDLDNSSAPPPAEPRRHLVLPCKPARSRKAAALAVVKTGLRGLPIEPNGKRPWLKDWRNRASSDPAVIEGWFKRDRTINFGVVCGDRDTRLWVVDIDPRHGGEASWEALEKPGLLEGPAGWGTVATPGGGVHLWFVVPPDREIPGNSTGRLGAGIDTRGAGGYVLCPPSALDGRQYAWNPFGSIVCSAPDWLLLGVPSCGSSSRTPEAWLDLTANGVDQGARNSSIAALAGKVFRHFPMAEFETAAELVACWNQVRVRPPLGPDELARTLDSIADREAFRRGVEQTERELDAWERRRKALLRQDREGRR